MKIQLLLLYIIWVCSRLFIGLAQATTPDDDGLILHLPFDGNARGVSNGGQL